MVTAARKLKDMFLGEKLWQTILLFSCLAGSTLYDSMDCSNPGYTVLQYLPKLLLFMSIESMMLSNHLILCLSLLLLPSIFPIIKVFSKGLALRIRWHKYWSFSFNISPSSEYSQLIPIMIDWSVFLAVQGTFKGLLQPHSSKASILQLSALFIVQLLHRT